MKNLILMIAVLVLSACASMPTMKIVAGTYELKADGYTEKEIFLENGIAEIYQNGKKDEEEYKWKLVDGQIYEETIDGNIIVYRINEDGSITSIAFMNNKGDRSEASKEAQHTYKKIK